MKNFNFEEYKKRVNRKEMKKDVENLASKLEGILFGSKKWVYSVIIPTIEILINIATLLGSNDDDNDEW